MSLETPLAKVRGLGSARHGAHHWWRQRLTAIALAPLSLWFIYELTTLSSFEYSSVRLWIATPSTAIMLVLFIPTLFHHAQLGVQVVIEDYIESEWQKVTSLILMKFLAALCAIISVLAIIKIYMGL